MSYHDKWTRYTADESFTDAEQDAVDGVLRECEEAAPWLWWYEPNGQPVAYHNVTGRDGERYSTTRELASNEFWCRVIGLTEAPLEDDDDLAYYDGFEVNVRFLRDRKTGALTRARYPFDGAWVQLKTGGWFEWLAPREDPLWQFFGGGRTIAKALSNVFTMLRDRAEYFTRISGDTSAASVADMFPDAPSSSD